MKANSSIHMYPPSVRRIVKIHLCRFMQPTLILKPTLLQALSRVTESQPYSQGTSTTHQQDNQNTRRNGMHISRGICDLEKLRGFFQRGSTVQPTGLNVAAIRTYDAHVQAASVPARSIAHSSRPETDSRAPRRLVTLRARYS